MTTQIRTHGGILLASLLLFGCADSELAGPPPPPPPAPAVASIDLQPTEQLLAVGQSLQLIALPEDAAGEVIHGVAVTWRSNAPATIAVSELGVVTALAQGQATITASAGGRQASALIRAEVAAVPGTVARVDLDRLDLDLDEGGNHQFVAIPRAPSGDPIEGLGMIWTSSDPEVASVLPGHGLVTALRPGTATITVRVHGKQASAQVSVTAGHTHDLVYSAWYGGAGQSPVLALVDPRSPARLTVPILPGDVAGTQPAPSPDGWRVAFSRITGWGVRKLYILDRVTGVVAPASDAAMFESGDDDSPAWSPDGQRIAFRRQVAGQGGRIWVMNADGTGRQDLTADQPGASHFHPAWSPALVGQGYRIAYVRSAAGQAHLYTMRPDGTGKRQLTGLTSETWDDQPSWSPDGTTIAFVRVGLTMDIWLVDAGTGNARPLVTWPMQQFAPAWSPDGRQVAFISGGTVGAGSQVFTVWASGPARFAQRTSDASDKNFPAWIRRN